MDKLRSFDDYLTRKRAEHGEKFDPSDLAPSFIPYFESGERIKVAMTGGEGGEVTGTVGVTTGWRPVFLLMLRSSSRGSSLTLKDSDKVVAVKKGKTYQQLATAATVLTCLLSFPFTASASDVPCRVNVNSATPQQLGYLYRTGEVLAGRIVESRPLDSAKLDAVKGVGEGWLAVNGPHVAYDGETTCTGKVKGPEKVEKVSTVAVVDPKGR